jgi:hypothetical protein
MPVKIAPSTRLVFFARRALEITLPKLCPRRTTFLGLAPNFPERICATSCSRMASWIETWATYPETLQGEVSVSAQKRGERGGRIRTLMILRGRVCRRRILNGLSLWHSLQSCSSRVRILDPNNCLPVSHTSRSSDMGSHLLSKPKPCEASKTVPLPPFVGAQNVPAIS